VIMQNLLGDLWDRGTPRWDVLLADSTVTLHLYGKDKPAPGRKMGHFSCTAPTVNEALEAANRLRHLLQGTTKQAKAPPRVLAPGIPGLS